MSLHEAYGCGCQMMALFDLEGKLIAWYCLSCANTTELT